MTTASATVNAILARLGGLHSPVVEEASLDCAGCAKAWKCCDFQPFVANFLLGAMLEQGLQLPPLEDRAVLQPLGLMPTHEFRIKHAQTPVEARGADLACSFFDRAQRRCSVWEFRPGECSAYLCSEPSLARVELSERSFRLEAGLSQMALAEQGFSPEEIAQQIDFLNEPGRGMRSDADSFEVYRQAWAWAKALDAADVARILEN